MLKIDSSSETILGVTYDLYSVKLSELKILAKSWYEGVDLKKFDSRDVKENTRDEINIIEMKKSGLICNLFYVLHKLKRTPKIKDSILLP